MLFGNFKNIKSTKKELKEFGLTMAAVLSLLNLFFFWKGGEIFIPLVFLSSLFLFLSLVCVVILTPLYKIWMLFSAAVGKITTCLILTLLFYLIVTPIGLVMRLLQKSPLKLKFNPEQNSYWLKKKELSQSTYEKQF